MGELIIEAERRSTTGKNANRRMRAAGKVPAVIYGRKTVPISLTLDPRDVLRVLHSESGQNTIFKLKLGEETSDVLIREFQLDPVRGELLHADLQTIALDEVRTFDVPIETVGTPEGVKLGGILDIVLRQIELECLPGDLPDNIEVDVSALEIGDTLRVEDLQVGTSKVTVLSDPDLVVVTVVPPVVEPVEEEEVAEEEAAAAEPELIKKGKEEGEDQTEESS